MGVILGLKVNFRVFLRVKKVKNLGSPIFMKLSPEKYFDARNSMVAKFFVNFDPQGVILGVKGQF